MSIPPDISVILPVYNAAATLGATLDSVLAQSFHRFELLIVEDGSEDDSPAIAAAYARRDPRIRVLQPGRQGQVGAMNSGLHAARAPIVARMDADDRMYPERLACQYRHLQAHPELTLVGSRVRLTPPERIQDGFREYIRWQNHCCSRRAIADAIYIELPIAHPTVMFRRAAVLGLGGYREGPFPEDYELLLRLHHHGHLMEKLPAIHLDWHESAGRLTRTDPRYAREAFDQVRAAYLACDPRLQEGRPLVIMGAGRRTRKRAQHLLEHGYPLQAWVDIDPRKIGNRIRQRPVVAPEWLAGRTPKPLVLCYVNNHGARDQIRPVLEAMHYREGRDYLMVG